MEIVAGTRQHQLVRSFRNSGWSELGRVGWKRPAECVWVAGRVILSHVPNPTPSTFISLSTPFYSLRNFRSIFLSRLKYIKKNQDDFSLWVNGGMKGKRPFSTLFCYFATGPQANMAAAVTYT